MVEKPVINCDSCEKSLKVIDYATQYRTDLNIVILLNSDINIQNIFGDRVKIHLIPPTIRSQYLKMHFLPVSFSINLGKLIRAHRDVSVFNELVTPLFTHKGAKFE